MKIQQYNTVTVSYLPNVRSFMFPLRIMITAKTTHAIKPIVITATTAPTIAGIGFELEEDEASVLVLVEFSNIIAVSVNC